MAAKPVHQMQQRTCCICNVRFITTRKHAVTCGPRCRQILSRCVRANNLLAQGVAHHYEALRAGKPHACCCFGCGALVELAPRPAWVQRLFDRTN
jgi:hypothetical protein